MHSWESGVLCLQVIIVFAVTVSGAEFHVQSLTVLNENGTPLCQAEGRVPFPQDCSAYIECLPDPQGTLTFRVGSCQGAYFDGATKTCVGMLESNSCQYTGKEERSNLETTDDQGPCAERGNGFYCADCKTVVTCVDGRAYPYTCGGVNTCDVRPSFGGAVCYPGQPSNCSCRNVNEFQVDVYDPRKFFFCERPAMDYKVYQCPFGMVFDAASVRCVQATGLPQCERMGMFARPGDCRQYYVCVMTLEGWLQKVFSCGVDPLLGELFFNEVTEKCEDPCGWFTDPEGYPCKTEGRFAIPSDCRRYVECVAIDGGFRRLERECPLGHSWDPTALGDFGHCVLDSSNLGCVPRNTSSTLCTVPKERCTQESASSTILPQEGQEGLLEEEVTTPYIPGTSISTQGHLVEEIPTTITSETSTSTQGHLEEEIPTTIASETSTSTEGHLEEEIPTTIASETSTSQEGLLEEENPVTTTLGTSTLPEGPTPTTLAPPQVPPVVGSPPALPPAPPSIPPPPADAPPSPCPPPFSLVSGECFFVTEEDNRRNHADADTYCSLLGGHLASPSDVWALRNFVLGRLGVTYVRIGATKTRPSGNWVWQDGRLVSSDSWGPRQPDNVGGREDCALLNTNLKWSGPLNDFSCKGIFSFVCQYNTNSAVFK